MVDPSSYFGSPDEVLRNAGLSRETKIEILCRWAYDTAELAVAEEEGMGGGEPPDLGAVRRALDEVAGAGAQSSAPTKQGGTCPLR